jgi:hypothetical protein
MSKDNDNTIYKSILGAFLILITHVFLIGFIGALVLFFNGIVNHSAWLILGVLTIISGAAYWFYRRIKSDGKVIQDVVGDSLLKGKNVEVSFLSGMATFKVSDSQDGKAINVLPSDQPQQLEDPGTNKVKDLKELARLYEDRLITLDEYNKAKEDFFRKKS